MNFYGLILYVYGERRMESSLSNRQGIKSNLILDFIASGPLWIDRRCCSTSVHFLSGETFSSCRWWFMKYAWNHDQSHCARGLVEAEKSWGYVAGHGQTARRVGKSWPKLRNGNDQWLWSWTTIDHQHLKLNVARFTPRNVIRTIFIHSI